MHPLKKLNPTGTCKALASGWLFKNPTANVPLNIYRTIRIDLDEISYLGENNPIELTIDWLFFDGFTKKMMFNSEESGGECSFYLYEHHSANRWSLEIQKPNSSDLVPFSFEAVFDFAGIEDDPIQGLVLSGSGLIEVGEISVMPANFTPAPKDIHEARHWLKAFIPDINSYQGQKRKLPFALDDTSFAYYFKK